jgi:plastocyanin
MLFSMILCCAGGAVAAGTIKGKIESSSPKKLANAVVYIDQAPGSFAPPAQHERMDQRGMTFIPHILPVVAGTTVDFLNNDNVRHNVFSPSQEKYNLGTWPTGEIKPHVFDKVGVYVQLCNVHPEMEAYVVVLQNPFFHLTGKDGTFEISSVPPGTYVLTAWHEKLKKPVQQTVIVVDGKETTVTFSY